MSEGTGLILPGDEHLHERNNDSFWNESAWFGFAVPERNMTGWFYFYHRPNMGFSEGGVALWDHTGENLWDCLYYDWDMHDFPQGADMFDFTLDNGLSVKCIEELKHHRLSYKSSEFQIECDFTAFMPPHNTGFEVGLLDEYGKGHFEQGGRVQGTMYLGGERIEIDCLNGRDHSWGRRKYGGTNPGGALIWAFASEDSAFLSIGVAPPGREDDQDVRAGWHHKDGQTARLVSGKHRLERDDQAKVTNVVVEATDASGREVHAVGRCTNHLTFYAYELYMPWFGTQWVFNGDECWGETQEYWPVQQSRKMIRKIKGL